MTRPDQFSYKRKKQETLLLTIDRQKQRQRQRRRKRNMPSQPPIPPLLTPYLAHSTHSAQSLTLITSVLAATSNWLLLRYLHDVLLSTTTASTTGIYDQSSLSNKYNDGDGDNRAKKIILVSFLRDWTFWKAEGKRLVCFSLSLSLFLLSLHVCFYTYSFTSR